MHFGIYLYLQIKTCYYMILKALIPCILSIGNAFVFFSLCVFVTCVFVSVCIPVTGKKRPGKKHIGKKRTGKKRICI